MRSSDSGNTFLKSLVIGSMMGLLLAVVFASGFFLRDLVDVPPVRAFSDDENASGSYGLLDEVQNLLDSVYLRTLPDYTIRQYAAIRGVLGTLEDRNTFFIEPPVAQSEADTLAGTYGGIGVILRRDEAGQFVLYPYPDGPASAAGVEDGDVLIAINGVSVSVSDQQDSVDQQMRGEVTDDNGVEITVMKPDSSEETYFIVFDVINVPSVVWRTILEDTRIGYVQIIRFTNRTPGEVEEAIAALAEQDISALILDLRNNSGGLLNESVQVASHFLDGGVVIYEKTRDGESSFEAETGGTATQLPLVVLVNQRTASASELVAGAIQDRDRGILIGQQTYGKGTVQQIFGLSDGSSVHITSSEWFTPSRTPLDGVGLTPDIAMIPDENGRDVETGEAIRYLQGLLDNTEGDS